MDSPDTTDNCADTTTKTSRPLEVFALIIGIDVYAESGETVKNLKGCVNDANDIVDFLQTDLQVPHSNVINLRDRDATAARIISSLQNLAVNPCITKGDIIVIFFAGHGAEAWPPKAWGSTDVMIQVLAPYDFHVGQSAVPRRQASTHGSMPGYSERAEDCAFIENGLTDIKFNQLLEGIADAKGNNIIVILDCCHSGYDTRDFGNNSEAMSPRSINLPKYTRLGADTFPAYRGSYELRENTLASHVLLSACGAHQYAYERGSRGVFTSSLTALLRSQDVVKMTYVDIISSLLDLHDQNPRCEGINRYRTFLECCTTGRCTTSTMYCITKNGTGSCTIDAGVAHGVAVGDEFTVYDTISGRNELGHVIINGTKPLWSSLCPVECCQVPYIPQSGAFALRTRVAENVRLLVDLKSERDYTLLARLMKHMAATSSGTPSYNLVANPEERPDLVISSSGNTVHFKITDGICSDEGLHEIFYRPAMEETAMETVLPGVAHFYWFLHHTATNAGIGRNVEVECFELTSGYIDWNLLRIVRFPTGGNLVKNNVINVEVTDSEQKCYGFRLKNKSHIPIFASVFYFDMSDLSISPYYTPSSPWGQDYSPCLPPYGSLTIGYGASNTPPRIFFLREGQNVDVGYIKLFLSTNYVDYHNVSQNSPFLVSSQCQGTKSALRCWDTFSIPIIQRRR